MGLALLFLSEKNINMEWWILLNDLLAQIAQTDGWPALPSWAKHQRRYAMYGPFHLTKAQFDATYFPIF
ncbi:MAG: hypothetical protein C6P37_01985 [Caldibacillus debilis]|uniref:Uncharacterized protein n=1 Tax=Caldibacillus debilis TaxID=301148 RepID=A0A3E0K7X3_9BACI|nr:MAG: hypothetical protein BAA03_01050 [Caldibacillus debilis]REJ18813.1 MAG: hypothetical protein C6W57_02885 [Caldibacillus debilis]REJ29239.1 MAG: hypothetical protein C6W56_06325 [Caldibacillus debilis]REJ31129.1 MAG: hypothetical protein C6P37_01985 [Caldibacillus debilis]